MIHSVVCVCVCVCVCVSVFLILWGFFMFAQFRQDAYAHGKWRRRPSCNEVRSCSRYDSVQRNLPFTLIFFVFFMTSCTTIAVLKLGGPPNAVLIAEPSAHILPVVGMMTCLRLVVRYNTGQYYTVELSTILHAGQYTTVELAVRYYRRGNIAL
jgi:hypothetical protein